MEAARSSETSLSYRNTILEISPSWKLQISLGVSYLKYHPAGIILKCVFGKYILLIVGINVFQNLLLLMWSCGQSTAVL
jgi:hypothetical protein